MDTNSFGIKHELDWELRAREEKICKEALENADVVCATCTVVGDGSILDILKPKHFNVAIVGIEISELFLDVVTSGEVYCCQGKLFPVFGTPRAPTTLEQATF